MKTQISLILCAAVATSAHALPIKKGETCARLQSETKAVHQSGITSRQAASRADELWTIDAPIYNIPEGGDYHLYNRTSEMIYSSYNGLVMATDEYFAGEVVYYDNGDVYMRNMIPSMVSQSYLKGKREGDKITVKFPQGLCYDDPYYDDDGTLVTDAIWPVFRAKYEIMPVWDEEYEEYVEGIEVWVDPDCQTVTFTIHDDGTITEDEGESVMIGVFTRGELWYGESAWKYSYVPFDQKPQTLPEGLVAEDWAYYDEYNARMTKMAFDGDDVYWVGAYSGMPKSVVKGKVSGNKVNFESPTYVGVDPVSAHLAYFCGAESVNNMLKIQDKASLSYDADKREMKYSRKYLIVNAGPSKPNIIWSSYSPGLHFQGGDVQWANPKTPEIRWVTDFQYDPYVDQNTWYVVVDIPNIDVNNNLLDRGRMWYNFYFDDDLYWFDAQDYWLVEDSPDVPYTYNDDLNIYYQGTFQHTVFFYWTGYRKMCIQSVFEDENGNVYKSLPAEYINPNAGVPAVDAETPAQVNYYDLQGRKVQNPSGLVVKQMVYPDGSVKTQKVVIK